MKGRTFPKRFRTEALMGLVNLPVLFYRLLQRLQKLARTIEKPRFKKSLWCESKMATTQQCQQLHEVELLAVLKIDDAISPDCV